MRCPAYNACVIAPDRIALIFDMDNTVLGSRIDFLAIRRELIALLRESGATAESDDALTRRPVPELVAIGTAHDRAQGTDLARQMWVIIEAHEAMGLKDAGAIDGAPAVLRTLRERGYRLAILTNNSRRGAVAALRSAGLFELVETVVARDDVLAMKPSGDGVVEAVRRLGDVDRIYVIGDSWIDGAAAHKTGATFISYRRTPEELRARGVEPWRVISHLEELLSVRFVE